MNYNRELDVFIIFTFITFCSKNKCKKLKTFIYIKPSYQ